MDACQQARTSLGLPTSLLDCLGLSPDSGFGLVSYSWASCAGPCSWVLPLGWGTLVEFWALGIGLA